MYIFKPVLHARRILDSGGNRKVEKRKENPCLENLHSNKDIKDFGFIHFN